MFLHRSAATPALRAAALTAGALLLAGALVTLCAPATTAAVRAGRHARFDQLLVAGCSIASLGAAIALLATSLGVLADLLHGRTPKAGGPLRRLVLAACGVAVVAAAVTTGPARANPSLGGLPLPDRPSGAVAVSATVRVHPGDSLWSIAARHLGSRASDTDIAAYCRALHHHNRAVIGPDPDLVLPGQVLHLPHD